MLILTYDQIPESELSDQFDTLLELHMFAKYWLHGDYIDCHSFDEMKSRLNENGYQLREE